MIMEHYRVSNGLGFQFLLLGAFCNTFRLHGIPVMKPCMADFMNQGFQCLALAHPFLDHDFFIDRVVIALRTAVDISKADRNRTDCRERIHKHLVMRCISGQLRHIQFRERIPGCLREIEDLLHLEAGNGHFHFFRFRLSVCTQHGRACPGVNHFPFPSFLHRCRCNDRQSLLSPHHLPVELCLPGSIGGHPCCFRHLHRDQQHVVGTVMMKL